ncbi:hypothetical protein LCGC14_0533570 [marine sediment metagenome]|uniref:Uncharacterized protein n=1 Tax=marine sediment metagenome TaxID=412755 RepID=A0A0F9SDE2_9ZZZZ
MEELTAQITEDEQLQLWVKGKSVHCDQCCPDFSCCRPELLAPPEVRRAYQVANQKERSKYLGAFLGEAIATYDPKAKVYIAGITEEEPN